MAFRWPLRATTIPVSFMLALMSMHCMSAWEDASAGRLEPTSFERQVLEIRDSVLAANDTALSVLSRVPGIGSAIELNAPDDVSSAALEAMWIPFFENALIEMIHEETAGPTAIYYNPLMDVAMYTRWEPNPEGNYRIAQLSVMPGEYLQDVDATVPYLPQWMTAQDPFAELEGISTKRLHAFRTFEEASRRNLQDGTTYSDAADSFLVAEPRLTQSLIWRLEWRNLDWLPLTLATIQAALNAADGDALLAAAPATHPETASFIAELPDGFAEKLILDLILEDGGPNRILLGSGRYDGGTYVCASCEITGNACVLGGISILTVVREE